MWKLSKDGRINELYVFRRSETGPVVVGVLAFQGQGLIRKGAFKYAPTYLGTKGRWAIDPISLRLSPRWQLSNSLQSIEAPLAFHDSGPDGWGKSIIDRAYPELRFGIAEYLASGGDRRTGDLLYGPTAERPEIWRPASESSRMIAAEDDIGMLLDAAMEAEDGVATAEQIALLVPSSAIGGARPKARVRIGGHDWIAKFPSSSDRFDDPRIEAVCLDVAQAAGIRVPERRLLRLRRRTALLVKRFDRDEHGGALAYLSAGTLLKQATHVYTTNQTYRDIALVGQRIGAPDMMEEMYRRYVVNSLLHNTDDHLRNHAFLGDARGWRLSPAFDVVPCIGRPDHVCAAAPGIEHKWDPSGAGEVYLQFGLDAEVGKAIHAQATAAFSRIREFMDAREVSEKDRAFVLAGMATSVAPGRPASAKGQVDSAEETTRSEDEPRPAVGDAGRELKLVVTRDEVKEALRLLRKEEDGVPPARPSQSVERDGDGESGLVARALVAAGRFVILRIAPVGANALGPGRTLSGSEALNALEVGFGLGRYRSVQVDLDGLRRTDDQGSGSGSLGLLTHALDHTADRRASKAAAVPSPRISGKDHGRADS